MLVDAARFFYTLFDDNDVVRGKLNEAEPAFGIPASTYDTVIKSLSDPWHAYRLHQANTFYAERHAELVLDLLASSGRA